MRWSSEKPNVWESYGAEKILTSPTKWLQHLAWNSVNGVHQYFSPLLIRHNRQDYMLHLLWHRVNQFDHDSNHSYTCTIWHTFMEFFFPILLLWETGFLSYNILWLWFPLPSPPDTSPNSPLTQIYTLFSSPLRREASKKQWDVTKKN